VCIDDGGVVIDLTCDYEQHEHGVSASAAAASRLLLQQRPGGTRASAGGIVAAPGGYTEGGTRRGVAAAVAAMGGRTVDSGARRTQSEISLDHHAVSVAAKQFSSASALAPLADHHDDHSAPLLRSSNAGI
jgi:hypothetical protein